MLASSLLGACGARRAKWEPASAEGAIVDPGGGQHARDFHYRSGPPHEEGDAPGYVTWCASGGAPIVGLPVIDEQERAYVATSDGYLHAFERDGRFRWSYTVKGTPLGSVSLRPSDGTILLGTTARYIYAITQNGRLHFRYSTLSPVWSGLFALNPQTVVFMGHDWRLYALSNTGHRRYRVKAPTSPMGGPVIARNDVVWVPLEDGVARFEAALKLDRFAVPGPVEQIVVLDDSILARRGTDVFHVTATGEITEAGQARLLSGDGEVAIVVGDDDSIELVSGKGERVTRQLVVPDGVRTISAPPTKKGRFLWVPYDDGRVGMFDLGSGQGVFVEVGDGPLSQPVVGPSGTWAFIAEPGGEFCAVQISDLPAGG